MKQVRRLEDVLPKSVKKELGKHHCTTESVLAYQGQTMVSGPEEFEQRLKLSKDRSAIKYLQSLVAAGVMSRREYSKRMSPDYKGP
jgi:hypothetical protein